MADEDKFHQDGLGFSGGEHTIWRKASSDYPQAPQVIVLDMDHSEDVTHGQREFAFQYGLEGGQPFTPQPAEAASA